ncbi:MAG: hypothetical protein N3D10_04180 [Candidatus Micrarchaeota archaeon]|nr:hypothetical protein [Candidatus Micrarchaeota archaeon]
MDWENFKKKKLDALNFALKAGEVDNAIIPFLNLINSQEGLVSSSSCSGRILILKIKKSKKDAKKFLVWHRKITIKEFLSILRTLENKKFFWLRVEPFILHILAKDLENAKRVLLAMKAAGVKRGGINYISDKITIEIMGHGQLILPLYLVKNYSMLVKTANKIFEKNSAQAQKFYLALQKVFSKNKG